MERKLFVIAFSVFVFILSHTQIYGQFGAGAQLGFLNPIGENGSDAHYGFNFQGKYDVDENMRVGLNIGHYFRRETIPTFLGTTTITTAFTPITALFEYSFIKEDFEPYGGIDMGLYRAAVSSGQFSNSESYFGLAPTAGARYSISQKFFIDGGLKFHLILSDENTTSSAIGFNAGVLYYF